MSLLLQIFLSLLGFFAATAFCGNQASSMRFELLHRHGPELLGRRPITPENRIGELVRSDAMRKKMVSEMFRRRRRRASMVTGDENSFAMPMSSGAFARTGEYFVRFQVGTPAQKVLLVADTGSDLTWVNCQYGCRNCSSSGEGRRRGRRGRVFNADKSSSFSPIECSSTACKMTLPFSLVACPTPASPCGYDYQYFDGSDTKGFYANESATVVFSCGRRKKLKGVVIGCSSSSVGSAFRVADGVLGLGHSKYSFAVRATESAGGKFSYCLVDHLSPRNSSSYLAFGQGSTLTSAARHTPLAMEKRLEPFYAVHVTGISVGGALLPVPRFVWDVSGRGGVILDSGSSLTTLAEPAYRAVFSALRASLGRFERVEIEPFEFCFNATEGGYKEEMVPKLAVHFAGAARFEPHVKSYVIDVAKGVKCIGLLSAPWPTVSTVGNILQQNFMWEFDLHNGRLGFHPSACTS